MRFVSLFLCLLLMLPIEVFAQGGGAVSVYTTPGTTYSAAVDAYPGYALATDIVSITGSATKTIKIINIRISGFATGNNVVQVDLIKRSTADTGGTPTTLTAVPWDSSGPAATATIVSYASAPSLGALVGPLCACQVEIPAKAGVGGYITAWDFNKDGMSPVILHGPNEIVALNFVGVTPPAGGAFNITFEWIEQ